MVFGIGFACLTVHCNIFMIEMQVREKEEIETKMIAVWFAARCGSSYSLAATHNEARITDSQGSLLSPLIITRFCPGAA